MNNDSMLQQDVLAELQWEPSITAGHIGVTAVNGVVTLTGHVHSFAQKHAAETAAGRVKGVKAVAEEIEVRLGNGMMRSDEQIAEAAVTSIAWDGSVPADKVKVKVEKGWVTLTGEVKWQFQKQAAETDTRRLFGVIGVSNQIAIKPQVETADVHAKIMTALHRSWFDTANISVSADGGKVHLGGSVRTWFEREQAENAAWAAPGVTQVEDNIVIG